MPLSTFLDGREPSQLRGLAWLSLSDTVTILSRGGSSDAGGGATLTWGTAGAADCRIDPLKHRNVLQGGRIDERSTHVVTMPPTPVVSATDRLVIDGKGTFEVTSAPLTTREWMTQYEVMQIS